MQNKANKAMQRAVAIGLAVSALIVAAACAIPASIMKRMEKECIPLLIDARECALSENYSDARKMLQQAVSITEKRTDQLEFFFDHNILAELELKLRTACDLTHTRESSQLIAEIDGAIGRLKFLSGITRAGIGEVM